MTNLTKILVVDDEPLLENLIMQSFKPQVESKVLAFVFASSGIDALKKLEEDKEIGVILTDIKMQKMDGHTLLQCLSNQSRLYKIVVVSAYGDMSNIRKSMEEGASDFILKPFDLRDLEAALMNVVGQYQFVKRGLESKDKLIEIEKELQIARDIKRSFIPTEFPYFDNIKLAGEMIYSKFPGGDFFDFFPLKDHQMGIVVASVNAPGISASLNTAILQMLFRSMCTDDVNPLDSIKDIHQYLLSEMPCNTLSGLFYAVCNTESGEINYYTTGGILPFLISSKTLEPLQDTGKIQLKGSDKIFVTTGSLKDFKNNDGDGFELEKIRSILESSKALTSEDLVKKFHTSFYHFASGSTLPRDIPLFCFEYFKV